MTKRQEREWFFKLLFLLDFHPIEQADEQFQNFLLDQGIKEEAGGILHRRFLSFLECKENIDTLLSEAAKGWKISRMAKVDLTLLRMAVFEMRYEQVDTALAINEAVELAKTYGDSRSYAFVNGVLARVQTQLG